MDRVSEIELWHPPGIRLMITSQSFENGTVLRILMDRPRGNVLTGEMIRELDQEISSAGNTPGLRLVVLRGNGGHFSYGTAIEEHRREQAAGLLASFHKLVRDLVACPAPVAALVEGVCFGGGFELALCCHFVFARPNATFGCPEIKLGVFAPVLAALGPLRLGSCLTDRILLTGVSLDARDACRAGLVTEILSGIEDPESALLAWYRKHLQPLSPFALRMAVRASRTAMIEAVGAPLEKLERLYLDHVNSSFDAQEGIEAFLSHRKPAWKDS